MQQQTGHNVRRAGICVCATIAMPLIEKKITMKSRRTPEKRPSDVWSPKTEFHR